MDFAVIGTREPNAYQKSAIMYFLEMRPIKAVLHTGACTGVDQFAAERWLGMGGDIYLHLPWRSYEQAWISSLKEKYSGRGKVACLADKPGEANLKYIASQHHAKWDTLSDAAKKLHTRNVAIIQPCSVVLAAPSNKSWGGGTAMGIKIALHLDKKLIVKDMIKERTWTECGC